MEYFIDRPQTKQSTIDEFWTFQRNCTEMSPEDFMEFVRKNVKFATPAQLEGAMLFVDREITNFQTPPSRVHFLSTMIRPLINDAIENPVDLQQTLDL